jgi:zinc transporter ZupT
MGAALGWGTLAASSLVIGALVALRFSIGLRAIGLIMAFGSGVLISAVSFDLIEEASDMPPAMVPSPSGCSPAASCSSGATG